MSRLNQLVSDCRVKLAVWLAEDTDISLTQHLCYREREIETVLRSKDRIVANTLGGGHRLMNMFSVYYQPAYPDQFGKIEGHQELI